MNQSAAGVTGCQMLEAIMEREKVKAEKAKQERAIAKAEAKTEKALAKETEAVANSAEAVVKAVVTPKKKNSTECSSSKKGNAKTVGSSSKKGSPKTVVSSDKSVKKVKAQKAFISHEASRDQYLARSSMKGSKSFGYGSGREYKSSDMAKSAATLWLKKIEKPVHL